MQILNTEGIFTADINAGKVRFIAESLTLL